MAMNATRLENLIIARLKINAPAMFPDVVKSVTVQEHPRQDGTISFEVVERRGPMEVDEASLRPFARSIAEAVIAEITAGAEVDDQGVPAAPAGTWRIT
jgi:hypothetical protein